MSEIAIYQPPGELIPVAASPRGELDDWIMVADQVVRLAEVICRSPFVPDGLRGSAPATAAAILTGRELGLPPMTSLANIHVIHGRPGLSAMVMRALIQAQGHEWRDVEVTNTRVIVEGRRKGSADWTRASFSAADAQTAKLQLGGYPQDKLYARASARLARRAFADVIAGMPYAAEEIEDGIGDEDGPAAVAAAAIPDGAPPAEKPRTAQRAARKTAPPAERPQCPEALHDPEDGSLSRCQLPGGHEGRHKSGVITWGDRPAAAPSGDPSLPPLPGEDEPDASPEDNPGSVTPEQLTRIWATLNSEFGFGRDDKDAARAVCAEIAGRELTSSKDLSFREAGAVIDALAGFAETARRKELKPRTVLNGALSAQLASELPAQQPGDPRDAVLAHMDRLGVTGPDVGSYLTRLTGKQVADVDGLTRPQAKWAADRLAPLGSRDELEAAAVAAEERSGE